MSDDHATTKDDEPGSGDEPAGGDKSTADDEPTADDESAAGGRSTGTDPTDGTPPDEVPPECARNDLAVSARTSGDDGLSLDRRSWMRALGSLALFGGVGASAVGTGAAETADTSLTVDERIQQHRTGDLEIAVQNPDGSAVDGAQVSVTQQEHDFGFGTAVNANTLINSSSSGDNYRTYIPELFNKAVLENRHKWRFWENQQQLADDATNWLLDQGLDVRGHVCIWGRDGVSAIPDDIQTAIDDRDAQTIRDRSMQHIADIIGHYGNDVTEWEVVNEEMHVHQLHVGVYGDQIDQEEPWTGEVVPWTSQLMTDWYDQAASVIDSNGLDVGIAVNDFNHFAYDYVDGRYETEIDHINTSAVQLDSVGLQAHVAARTGENDTNSNPDGRLSASAVAAEMNQWADHGARLKITEFDTYQGSDWSGDQEKAQQLENYLRGAFSHPGVDDFLMWGFWDGRHWRSDAPLFYQDWSTKPGYDVWIGLVYDEWWTDESGTTDGSGVYATSTFLGDHEISVSTASDSATTTTSVMNPGGTTTVTVTVEGEGGGDTAAPTTPSNLSVASTATSSIGVEWDASSDTGGSGLDHYAVYVDGTQDHTVAAGTTSATVSGLSADTSYDVGVSAVDGAGNESATTTVSATTAGDGGGTGDALVVHEFEAGNYPGSNDLGNWADGDSLQNGAGTVSGGALRLEYDDSGWFGSNVNQSVADRPTLHLRIRGDAGGEESHFTVEVGGASDLLSNVTSDSIGTSYSTVSVDLSALGADLQNPQAVRLNFWQGASGAVEIDRIAFGGGGGGTGDSSAPTTPSNLSIAGTTSSSVSVEWNASSDAGGSGLDHYAVYVDGTQDHTVAAGTTSTTVSGLSADTSYEIGLSAVDGAGNESAATTVTATTATDDGGTGDTLLINDYDGSPAWSGQNDLGNWNGAGSLANGGGDGEVVSGELVLEYDDAGWAQERVDQDVSAYTDLVFVIRGASGGEGQHFTVGLGGATNTVADVADSTVTTTSSEARIDMQAAGIDRTAPAELQLDFWQGGSGASTIYVEEIRFE